MPDDRMITIDGKSWRLIHEAGEIGTHAAVLPDHEGSLPEGYDTCVNYHDGEGYHPEDLTYCEEGMRCPMCPCSHPECNWRDDD